MDLSEQSLHHFIELTYEAVESPARWRTLYDELQQAIEVASIHVLALDKQHGTLSYSDGANMPVDGELAYMQKYRFQDPRVPVILQRPLGAWTHCHEVLDEEAVACHPFYQEFLLPHDRRFMSGCKLVDEPEATMIFATLTSAAQGPLSAPVLDFLDRLMPHLRRACRIGLRNFVYSHQALVGHLLVDRLRQPVVLLTPGGQVMHSNEAAQQMMRGTRLVQVRDGMLRLPRPQQEELLRRCAELEQRMKAGASTGEAAEDATSPAAGQFQSLRIERAARAGEVAESIYGFYTMLTPQKVLGTFGLRPVVMLLFYQPAAAPAIDPSLLYAVFGLTPAEARIATLLAEGLSLKEIAEAQGTQHETVRKQLRSIYQKTATNRQPELVRLLLHLPHDAVRA